MTYSEHSEQGSQAKAYDIIVVGAGHAGCEAALAAARMGCRTLLVTMNLDAIALMPCNPSMGGPAKGHLIREIDALGGEIGRATDKTFIQIRLLNTGKGPAVQALRAQCDKKAYQQVLKYTLESTPNLDLKQASVARLLTTAGTNGKPAVAGIITTTGWEYHAPSVILTTGTFINGRLIVGENIRPGGRAGEAPALGISESLRALGFTIGRFKTGTPPRIDARTIDFSKTIVQPGSPVPLYFSGDKMARAEAWLPRPNPVYPVLEQTAWRPQLPCYLVHTTPQTHAIIRENLHRSPLFSGVIEGVGPRYCPSIEDKIVRFADKETHQLFLEPEGWQTSEVYVQGGNTSLPEDVQLALLRSIPALAQVEMMRVGYAVEYDYIPPDQISASLQTKPVDGLFLAGQINGTSGYEEAAAQGIMAGINAARWVRREAPFVLGRHEAYIGVLIDDLVTKPLTDPYRLHTSRAEYRLLLRQESADLRLSKHGYQFGLLSAERYAGVEAKQRQIAATLSQLDRLFFTGSRDQEDLLQALGMAPLGQRLSARAILRRPEVSYNELARFTNLLATHRAERAGQSYVGTQPGEAELGTPHRVALAACPPETNHASATVGVATLPELDHSVCEEVELEVKYEGYIQKQQQLVEQTRRLEEQVIPAGLDYSKITSLGNEAREKLQKYRPYTIGQASRIGGITPADISILLIYLEKKRRAPSAATGSSHEDTGG